MVDSFAGRTFNDVQRSLRKVTKALMRSHHFRIPIYDMPIRLRPVRLAIPYVPSDAELVIVVVYRVHVHRHAGLGFPRVHKLLSLHTAE